MNYRVFIFFLVAAFTVGCSNLNIKALPDIGIPQNVMNVNLKILTFPGDKQEIGDGLTLLVILQNDIFVRSGPYFNARIYLFDVNKRGWVETENIPFKGDKKDDIILRKDGSLGDRVILNLDPVILDKTKPVDVLVMISGDLYKDDQNTEQKVGAWIIVRMVPSD